MGEGVNEKLRPLQLNDLSNKSRSQPTLTTQTDGGIPTTSSFIGKAIPKGNQGSLIHSFGRGLGTVKNPKEIRKRESDQTPP